jgi:hypothetical protein
MKKTVKRELKNVIVYIMLIALLVSPLMTLAEGENPYDFGEIIIENEIITEGEIIAEGEIIVDGENDAEGGVIPEIEVALEDEEGLESFYEIPPPMPGEGEVEEEAIEATSEELFLSVSQSSWNPGPEASSITIFVTTNDNWGGIFPGPLGWLHIPLESTTSQVGDGSFDLRVTENTSTEPRTQTVSIGGRGGTQAGRATITVTQQGASGDDLPGDDLPGDDLPGDDLPGDDLPGDDLPGDDFLTVSPESLNTRAAADNIIIQVSSNTNWRVQFVTDGWIRITDIESGYSTGNTAGSFHIHIEENRGNQRSGTIFVTGGGITRSITVTQSRAGDPGEEDPGEEDPGEEDPPEDEPYILLSLLRWNISDAADSILIEVDSNVPWTATSNNPAWLSVSPGSSDGDRALEVTALANEREETRTGTITVRGGGITQSITVNQQGAAPKEPEPYLVVPNTITIQATDHNITFRNIDVNANVPWTAVSNDPSWITLSLGHGDGNGTIIANLRRNDTEELISGSITVTGGGITRTITINKRGRSFALSEVDLMFQGDAGGRVIYVNSSIQWDVTTITTEDGGDWLSVANVSRNNPGGEYRWGSFTIRVRANPGTQRSGVVTVAAGEVTRMITVTQNSTRGPVLSVSPLSWEAHHEGDETSKRVDSNVPWTATSNDPTWLTVESGSGTGDGSFQVVAAPNDTEQRRSGSVTVTGAGGDITQTISVTQEAVFLWIPSGDRLDFGAREDSTMIDIRSNTTWTATSDSPWLRARSVTIFGDYVLRINVSNNLRTGTTRTGLITISAGGLTRYIRVNQAAPLLDISQDSWVPSREGGETTINVVSDFEWTARSNNSSWLFVRHRGGTDGNSFRIVAEPNTGLLARDRTGTITVSSGGVTRTVTVTQGRRDMEQVEYWNSDSDTVGFFRGDVNVYASVIGETDSDFETYFLSEVTEAQTIWGDAIGVPIEESLDSQNAQVVAYGGSRRELEARSGVSNTTSSSWTVYTDVSLYTSIVYDSRMVISVYEFNRVETFHVDMSGEDDSLHNADYYRFLTIHELGSALGYFGYSPDVGVMSSESDLDLDDLPLELSVEEARHLRQIYDLFR